MTTIVKETKLEYKLTNTDKAELTAYLKKHPEHFPELIKLAIADKQPYSWRAAWVLWSCMDKNDKRIRKHIKKIIEALPNRKDNQQRELLIVLQRMELNGEHEGRLFDICSKIWQTVNKNPSLRFHAFKTMIEVSKKHMDLLPEIKSMTDRRYTKNLTENVSRAVLRMVGDA